MDSHQGVCQPTLKSCRQDTHTGADPTSHHSASGTSVEVPTMVSYTPTHVSRLPGANNSRNRNNDQQGQPSDSPTTSRRAYLRERYRSQTPFRGSSWRTKTNKSYDSLFAKWHHWCSEQSSDPFFGPIAQVANFLAHLYKEGYQYSSVNAYQFAVHEKVDATQWATTLRYVDLSKESSTSFFMCA